MKTPALLTGGCLLLLSCLGQAQHAGTLADANPKETRTAASGRPSDRQPAPNAVLGVSPEITPTPGATPGPTPGNTPTPSPSPIPSPTPEATPEATPGVSPGVTPAPAREPR